MAVSEPCFSRRFQTEVWIDARVDSCVRRRRAADGANTEPPQRADSSNATKGPDLRCLYVDYAHLAPLPFSHAILFCAGIQQAGVRGPPRAPLLVDFHRYW